MINLNLKSVFFLSQAVARQFIQQGDGGKIVNIASMLSFQGDSGTLLHRVKKRRTGHYPPDGQRMGGASHQR